MRWIALGLGLALALAAVALLLRRRAPSRTGVFRLRASAAKLRLARQSAEDVRDDGPHVSFRAPPIDAGDLLAKLPPPAVPGSLGATDGRGDLLELGARAAARASKTR